MKFPLTPKQKRMLDSILLYWKTKGYMPSVRDLMGLTESALGTVHEHLKALERKGWIIVDGTSRGIHVLTETAESSDAVEVPITSTLTASGLIKADPAHKDTINLPRSVAVHGSFAIRVSGDGLADEHVLDSDLVIVAPQAQVGDGEIALVLLDDNTAALKRVYRERHRIRLFPIAAEKKPITVRALRSQGKVTALLRLYRP